MTSQVDASSVQTLEPKAVWKLFSGIAAVPRPSKVEDRIRAHVLHVAEENDLLARVDAVGNVVIDAPASEGHADAPITVLQAHLDMVCEKNSGTKHDFDKDPIRLIVDQEGADGTQIVRADGTTLGADNGIGVAMALAAATSPDVVHGPLELLFTIDEEAGMTGAKGLSHESFLGRRMLNLDSEEDDALYIGCAGGCDTTLTWSFPLADVLKGYEICRVSVSGLRGGHSGGDIHEGRGSAIKLLARTLRRAPGGAVQILAISGGSKRNAIPREAMAVVAGPPGMHGELAGAADAVKGETACESGERDGVIRVEQLPQGLPTVALSAEDTDRLLCVLAALPHGVLGMHPKVDGLVETSNNVATVATSSKGANATVAVGTLTRSSSASRMQEALDQIASIGRLAGGSIETANEYPGWAPNPDSPTLAVCRRVYKELFGAEPNVAAIHAGLECGIIGERVGNMDTVSFGPTIRGAHSPDERVYVASVQKSWTYLKAVLAELAHG